MLDLASIEKPTLLLDETRARRNLARMAAKARQVGARFRPHFKTHQSAEMGAWFRDEGVRAITVSSVDMAAYFATAGWEDILIAFSANPRQVATIDALAGQVHLGLLMESTEVAAFFEQRLTHAVDAWIKVDVGSHRTGIAVDEHERLAALARQMGRGVHLRLRGLLTHAGHTYRAASPDEVVSITAQCLADMRQAQQSLAAGGIPGLELSYGDTPGCTLAQDFSGVAEIRPGNFIFYDVMQNHLGVCSQDELAVAVACPLVAKHAARDEHGAQRRLVFYGGAVHLSKENISVDGRPLYGRLADLNAGGWGQFLPEAGLTSLSQEHGLARVSAETFAAAQVGDLLAVLPVHSCLTVNLFDEYWTTEGRRIAIKR